MSVDSKRKAIRIVSFIGDAASSVLCAYFVAFFSDVQTAYTSCIISPCQLPSFFSTHCSICIHSKPRAFTIR